MSEAETIASFPILRTRGWKSGEGDTIPWPAIAGHERQARTNHHQSLQRLAERGGLSWSEAAAVMQDREWHSMEDDEAKFVVLSLCAILTEPAPRGGS